MATGLDGGIAEKLQRYAAARNIERGSVQWRELLRGYEQNPQFTELLDRELVKISPPEQRRT
jgi:hypothetical protein